MAHAPLITADLVRPPPPEKKKTLLILNINVCSPTLSARGRNPKQGQRQHAPVCFQNPECKLQQQEHEHEHEHDVYCAAGKRIGQWQ